MEDSRRFPSKRFVFLVKIISS